MSACAFPEGAVVERLVDAATVRVEVVELVDGRRVVRKLYSFPRLEQRLRGALRHSWLGRPKGEREAANLERLARGGAAVLAPLGWGSRRDRLGFVRESWLVLPYLERRATLEQILCGAAEVPGAGEEGALWREVGVSVRRIHDLGCFYRDLRPRNLLVAPGDLRWIDASKSRWTPAPLPRPLAAEDLAGFLLPLDLAPRRAAQVWSAFREGYCDFEDLAELEELPRELGWGGRRRLRKCVARERDRLRV